MVESGSLIPPEFDGGVARSGTRKEMRDIT
jgi:hypothetical protein